MGAEMTAYFRPDDTFIETLCVLVSSEGFRDVNRRYGT
jgi:hypothetical protein